MSEQHDGGVVCGQEMDGGMVHIAYTSGDRVLAAGMFVLAFLVGDTFGLFTYPGLYGIGVSFTAILFGFSIWAYAKKERQVLPRESCFWLLIMILNALSYMFIYHQSLGWFHPIFLRLTVLYTIVVSLGALLKDRSSEFLIFDTINMMFIIPFSNYVEQWRLVHGELQNKKPISSVIKGLLGLLAALPLLVVVGALLASADARFGELLSNISDQLGGELSRLLGVFILSLLTGSYLFGLFYGSAHKAATDTFRKESIESSVSACAVIPAVSIYTVLLAVSLMYLLFIGLQGGYYLSAMQGLLPEEFTYSEYARRGFFELVIVSLINLAMLGAAALFSNTKGAVLKVFYILLCIETLFLIGTAITKMFMYIGVYGLTPLRVIPSVFMIYLAFLFLLIVIKQFRPLPFQRVSLLVFAAGYTLLSLSDMDGRIAAYNLKRYEQGSLTEITDSLLIDGSLASIPALYRMWQRTEPGELKDELKRIVDVIADNRNGVLRESEAWRYMSIPKYNAQQYILQMDRE